MLSVVEMGHSSNLSIIGSTFNSAHDGDLHIHNKESGMHNFRSVQKSILIDDRDAMKDFVN